MPKAALTDPNVSAVTTGRTISAMSITTQAPADAVELRESISLSESVGDNALFDVDGTIPIHIIRPGIGRGRGRHLYEAEMLSENAHKFANWKMYVDHLSPEARKAAGGLPRSIRDLGGRIVEAWWDDSVPADPVRGYGQGAVVGRAKPTPFVRELIENDPEIVEASISATATGVRPVVRDGQKVWCVEGIEDRGSVDWVTEAGAGGRVAALLEAAHMDESEVDSVVLDSMSDDELLSYISEQRPNLTEGKKMETKAENAKDTAPEDSAEDKAQDVLEDTDAIAKRVKELVAKGMPEKMATAIAKKEAAKSVKEAAEVVESTEPMDIQKMLIEALRDSDEAQMLVTGLVEARLETERAAIVSDALASAERDIELRDLRDMAHRMIAESKLPESWQGELKAKFDIVEGEPTDALDVVDVVNEEGAVVKQAVEMLAESVALEVANDRKKLAEASPTRVRNQGPSTPEAQDDKASTPSKPSYWRNVLEEAGVDPNKAYNG
jgi:hypothetical protein